MRSPVSKSKYSDDKKKKEKALIAKVKSEKNMINSDREKPYTQHKSQATCSQELSPLPLDFLCT